MTAAGDRRLASACFMGSFEGPLVPPWLLRAVRDGLGGVVLFASNVVDDAQVAAVPGVAFGVSPAFRVSYATSEDILTEACRRIQDACEKLS